MVKQGIALKRVNGLVSTLFENVDDALFHLAERAESNAMQVQFFDGMREVRKKRQLVERRIYRVAALPAVTPTWYQLDDRKVLYLGPPPPLLATMSRLSTRSVILTAMFRSL